MYTKASDEKLLYHTRIFVLFFDKLTIMCLMHSLYNTMCTLVHTEHPVEANIRSYTPNYNGAKTQRVLNQSCPASEYYNGYNIL